MLARSSVLFLLAGTCWAETAVPKPRPRLPPVVVSEVKQEAAQPALDAGSAPSFRSFGDFLQAKSRRPVGLEAVPEVAAARAEAARTAKAGQDAKGSPGSSQAYVAGADVLVLPKIEVTVERLTKLEKELAALEANQSWETSSAEAWETRSETSKVVDAILNPSFFRLGGYSAAGRAYTARQRVELLRWVRVLRISLEEAKTPADKARIQADIEGLWDIMRWWE